MPRKRGSGALRFEYNGDLYTLNELSEIFGYEPATWYYRLVKKKLPIEHWLSLPDRKYRRRGKGWCLNHLRYCDASDPRKHRKR
jgi:hypothetical protein